MCASASLNGHPKFRYHNVTNICLVEKLIIPALVESAKFCIYLQITYLTAG